MGILGIKCVNLYINIHILINTVICLCLINASSVFCLIYLIIFNQACLYIVLYFLLSSFFLKERSLYTSCFFFFFLIDHHSQYITRLFKSFSQTCLIALVLSLRAPMAWSTFNYKPAK